jgi:hypothetical protein
VVSSTAGTPTTGTVTFTDSVSGTLGTGTLVATSATSATYRLIYTYPVSATRGIRNITAQYAGTTLFAQSPVSNPLSINVVNTTVSVTASPTIITPRQAVSFTALVTSPSGAIPSGVYTVNFYDGTTFLGSATVNNGKATLAVPANSNWTLGTHRITASFVGDANFDSTLSNPLSFVVRNSGLVQ